jgi:hypothetical protein
LGLNVVAPYLLTALMTPSDRLVFLSSGTHRRGDADLADLQWERRPWDGGQAYADSKLWDVVLALAVARRRRAGPWLGWLEPERARYVDRHPKSVAPARLANRTLGSLRAR